MRFLLDEFPHKLLAFLIVQDDDLDPFGLQMILTPHKRLVLGYDDPCNLVQDASTGAHVTGTERSIHRGTFVSRSRQAT